MFAAEPVVLAGAVVVGMVWSAPVVTVAAVV